MRLEKLLGLGFFASCAHRPVELHVTVPYDVPVAVISDVDGDGFYERREITMFQREDPEKGFPPRKYVQIGYDNDQDGELDDPGTLNVYDWTEKGWKLVSSRPMD